MKNHWVALWRVNDFICKKMEHLQESNSKWINDNFVQNVQHGVLVTFFVGWTFSQICRVTIIILSASKNVTQCSVEFDHLSRVKILSSIWSTVGPSTFKIYSENAQALQIKSTMKSYMGIVLIFIDIDPCFFLRHTDV